VSAGEGRLNVLLVEDASYLREIFKEQFKELGYIVSEASNGKMGLQILKTKQFDLVFCDVEMLEMDGMEFLIEAKKLGPKIKIHIMSGGHRYTVDEFLKNGAAGFVKKPFVVRDYLKNFKQ
jgi:two-component system nitrogen regulation response regulator NtrX